MFCLSYASHSRYGIFAQVAAVHKSEFKVPDAMDRPPIRAAQLPLPGTVSECLIVDHWKAKIDPFEKAQRAKRILQNELISFR
jgi:hypothetical protein